MKRRWLELTNYAKKSIDADSKTIMDKIQKYVNPSVINSSCYRGKNKENAQNILKREKSIFAYKIKIYSVK